MHRWWAMLVCATRGRKFASMYILCGYRQHRVTTLQSVSELHVLYTPYSPTQLITTSLRPRPTCGPGYKATLPPVVAVTVSHQLRTLFGWMTLPMRVRRTLFSKLLRLRDCTIRSRRGIHDPACFVICKYGTTTSETVWNNHQWDSMEQPPVRQYGTTTSEIDTVKQSYVEPAGCTQLIKNFHLNKST